VLAGLTACGGGGGESGGSASSGASGSIGNGPGSVTLQWTGANDSRVTGYRVYVGTSSGNYLWAKGGGINAGGSSSSVVSGLNTGQTYYFSVTSYDSSGNESDFSAEASKTIN
jgi:hypothetical protein